MSKWEMVKLGECIKLVSGKFLPVKHRIDGEYNVYGGNGITGIHNEYFIDYQTVVIGRVGEYCGCVHMTDEKVWITDNALYVNKFLRDIHRKYLCYVLNSKKLNHYANKSGQPSISQSAILKIQIPLPPLDVQKKIAQTLDVAAELIALRKKQLAELDNLIKATFYDMFGDPVVNEKMWSLEEMGNLGECNSGGTPTRSNPSYFLGDIDWYSAGELNQRYLIQSKERLTIDAIKNSAAKIFKKRSMLIGMYDTAAFKLGILTKDSASNQACANISVNADLVNIVWLYDCAQIMRPFFLTSRRGIRQKNLNLGMIKRFKIPLPPISLQNEFAEIVTKIEEQKSLVQKAIDESQYLFDSLMSEYFE